MNAQRLADCLGDRTAGDWAERDRLTVRRTNEHAMAARIEAEWSREAEVSEDFEHYVDAKVEALVQGEALAAQVETLREALRQEWLEDPRIRSDWHRELQRERDDHAADQHYFDANPDACSHL